MMTICSPLKHGLAFSLSHIHFLFVVFVVFRWAQLPYDHWNVREKKNIFHKREKEVNILGGKTSTDIFKNLKKWFSAYCTWVTPISVNDSFGYTDKAAHNVFHLYSSVCIYRTKAQTMAIGFQRKNPRCKELFYLIQIFYLCMIIDKWQNLSGHYSFQF